MTYQGDPNRPRRRPQDYVRRDDGSWSVVPIVLVAALLLGLGYLLLGDWNTETGPTRTTDGANRPATAPPATSPPPATKP
jgi:hypothetical protein